VSAEFDRAVGCPVANYVGTYMTPEKLNRLAMWGTIGILVVAGAVFGVRQAVGDGTNSTAVLPALASSAFDSPSTGPLTGAPPTTSTTAGSAVQSIDTTVTPPGSSVESVAADLIRSGVAQSTTTTSLTTSAIPVTTSATSVTTVPTTTTTTIPTTTIPTTTTTTTIPTTTIPTTTIPTTTIPTTTIPTTTIPTQGLFVVGFGGQAQGATDDWSVSLGVDLGATVGGTWRAQVYVSWSGDGSGTTVLETGGSGKASTVVGPFTGSSVVFTITDIRSTGWVYLPALNRSATLLTVLAPGG